MPRFSAEYLAYMQSPAWQQFRARVKARDKYRCVRCGSRERLEVDHLTYDRLGRERLEDCQTLCQPCHRKKTRRTRGRRFARRHPGLVLWLLVLLVLGVMKVAMMFLAWLGR